jgi:hypothetical protein
MSALKPVLEVAELAITELPEVTAADALDDRIWFTDHPDRRFRDRAGDGGLWLIRYRLQSADPDIYLRSFSMSIAAPRSDSDGEIAPLWYAAAYPDWPIEMTQKRARKALRKGAS